MVKKVLSLGLVILLFAVVFCSCKGNNDGVKQTKTTEITVCAAASLKDALLEIQSAFEKKGSIKLAFNFASSGVLQKQIEEGAPADLFISAGKKQMDVLSGEKMVESDTLVNLLTNKLVMIVSDDYKDSIRSVDDIINMNVKLSIGQPDTVPAGQYARESLQSMSLWDKLKDKIVYAKDVIQVTTYVERGEAAAGIVYSSDCMSLKGSFVAQVFDENSHSPIVYPAAVVSSSSLKEHAKGFLNFLSSEESLKVFEKYGFDIFK